MNKKVSWVGFANSNHSWGICAQNISRQLIKLNNSVDIYSTNGSNFFPDDLKPYLKGSCTVEEMMSNKINISKLPLDNDYDLQLSYTLPTNFSRYFNRGKPNSLKYSIWCYEWQLFPKGFSKNYIYVNKILAPSTFAYENFLKNGVPEDHLEIIPHGINIEDFNVEPYKLKTKKTIKILMNIGQAHIRKNIVGALDAIGKAFTNKDDVCLVAKISFSKIESIHCVDVIDIFKKFKQKYKNHCEIELITHHVPNIFALYKSCDIVYSLSFCEAFNMVALEAIGANKINICPRYGGQLDFLNDDNSLLVNGCIKRASNNEQYWQANPLNSHFEANIDDTVNKLKYAYINYNNLINKFSPNWQNIKEKYTWENVANQIIKL